MKAEDCRCAKIKMGCGVVDTIQTTPQTTLKFYRVYGEDQIL